MGWTKLMRPNYSAGPPLHFALFYSPSWRSGQKICREFPGILKMKYVRPLNLFLDLHRTKALQSGGRFLGLDVGDKYVGLAVSDLDNKIASPLRYSSKLFLWKLWIFNINVYGCDEMYMFKDEFQCSAVFCSGRNLLCHWWPLISRIWWVLLLSYHAFFFFCLILFLFLCMYCSFMNH